MLHFFLQLDKHVTSHLKQVSREVNELIERGNHKVAILNIPQKFQGCVLPSQNLELQSLIDAPSIYLGNVPKMREGHEFSELNLRLRKSRRYSTQSLIEE